jgi:hypothetical protein
MGLDGGVSQCPQHEHGYRNTRRIGTCVGKIWTNAFVIMYFFIVSVQRVIETGITVYNRSF